MVHAQSWSFAPQLTTTGSMKLAEDVHRTCPVYSQLGFSRLSRKTRVYSSSDWAQKGCAGEVHEVPTSCGWQVVRICPVTLCFSPSFTTKLSKIDFSFKKKKFSYAVLVFVHLHSRRHRGFYCLPLRLRRQAWRLLHAWRHAPCQTEQWKGSTAKFLYQTMSIIAVFQLIKSKYAHLISILLMIKILEELSYLYTSESIKRISFEIPTR